MATFAVAAVVALAAARSIANLGGGHVPKSLAIFVALAGGTVMLNLRAEQLLLPWLFLAPLFQESAAKSRGGHLLSLALYTVPILFVTLKVVVARRVWRTREWYDVLPALFVGYAFASIVVTSPRTLQFSVVGNLRSFFQTVVLGPLLYYLVMWWKQDRVPWIGLCRAFLWAAAIQAAMTTVEIVTRWNLWHDTTWQEPADTRAIGTLTNPALTGAFIGAGIVAGAAILIWRGPRTLHRAAALAVVIGVPGILATKTRGPILATAIVVTLLLLVGARARVFGVALIAVVALMIAFFWPQIRSSTLYQSRVDEQQNIQIRLVLQTISIRLAEQKPILGWGYDSFDRVKFNVPVTSAAVPLPLALRFTSHDTFLTLLVEYGIVGVALFIIPWIVILLRAVRASRARAEDRWLFALCVGGMLVIGLTATTLDYRFFSFVPALAWLLMALVRRSVEPAARVA